MGRNMGRNMGQRRTNKVSLLQLFLTFAKVGAFTIGGGYAMVSVMRDETVGKGWISDDEFADMLALSQAAPGLLAVNVSIFVGYRLRKTKGSIAAAIGGVLPPFLIILLIAMVFSNFWDNPVVIRIFKGIRPVVVALIAAPMMQMAKGACKAWWSWLVAAASLALVAFLKVSPIYILLSVAVIGLYLSLIRDKKLKISNIRSLLSAREAAKAEANGDAEAEVEAMGGESETEARAGANVQATGDGAAAESEAEARAGKRVGEQATGRVNDDAVDKADEKEDRQ